MGMPQRTAFFAMLNLNYLKERILNETLLNNITVALARPTVITQNSSTPFPNENRFFGRTVSQGDYFSPPPVQSQRPTYSWGGNTQWSKM